MNIESPVRADHTYLQHLEGPPNEVFPLLCPVREAEWVKGWNPGKVISVAGVAELGCIFTTSDNHGTSTWIVSRYEPRRHRIEFVKFTPGYFVTFISIEVCSDGPEKSTAEVRYQYTAVEKAGETAIAAFTREAYEAFMKGWEDELNAFLLG